MGCPHCVGFDKAMAKPFAESKVIRAAVAWAHCQENAEPRLRLALIDAVEALATEQEGSGE